MLSPGPGPRPSSLASAPRHPNRTPRHSCPASSSHPPAPRFSTTWAGASYHSSLAAYLNPPPCRRTGESPVPSHSSPWTSSHITLSGSHIWGHVVTQGASVGAGVRDRQEGLTVPGLSTGQGPQLTACRAASWSENPLGSLLTRPLEVWEGQETKLRSCSGRGLGAPCRAKGPDLLVGSMPVTPFLR